MMGRDPGEKHRASTPLELLFDLTFVVAFGQAGDQASHFFAEGHFLAALGGFAFAIAAVCWAWVNFSWFASAYDTDDWFFRILTMVQMIGVLVLALGLPSMFDSIDRGGPIENGVMIAGYVIMRVALVIGWLRAAREDPARKSIALTYALLIGVAQVGWVLALGLRDSPLYVPVLAVLFLVEGAAPVLAEKKGGTPWHPHHIAERYGLLVIITLGEGIIGTIATVSAIVQEQGWSAEAVINVVAGTGLTFGLWWVYFILPSGEVLSRHRERASTWGYLHIIVFASIAATGAGLHVAAFVIEGTADVDERIAVLAVAVPVALFTVAVFGINSYLLRGVDSLQAFMLSGVAVVLGAAVLLADGTVPIGACLLLVLAAPLVVVVVFEVFGHRHEASALAKTTAA